MNSSLYTVDCIAHVKILAVATALAALVVLIRESAQVTQAVDGFRAVGSRQALPAAMQSHGDSNKTPKLSAYSPADAATEIG